MSAILHAVEGAERAEWPEPDMALVDGRRQPAPAPPLQIFRPFWSQWITDQAEAKSAPPDYVAAGLLSAAAAVIGNARWSSPWPGWKEPPTLWTASVGTPSSGKSPGLDAALELARQLEAGLNVDYPERRRAHQTKPEGARAARDAWTAEVKRARSNDRPAPSTPDGAIEPERPERRRLVATDATTEALGRLLAADRRGLPYFRDELAGWLGSMDRYAGGARGADRAFVPESFSGRPFVIDRVGSADPLHVPRPTVAVAGGIQPDRLASGLPAGDDDGLAARFLYFWPEPVPPRRPRRTADDAAAVLQEFRGRRPAAGRARSAAVLAGWLLANRETRCEAFRKAHDGRAPADQGLTVNARALHRRRPPGLKEPHGVRAALSELVEAGWLMPRPDRTGDAPGRRREDYRVNPRIWGDRRAGDRRAR